MKVNGNIIHLTKKYINDKYGIDRFNEVLNKIEKTDADSAKVLSGSIISSNMYDIGIDLKLIKAIESVFGKDIHKELGEFKVKSQITGFYGLVVKFLSIETLISRSQEMWNKTYSEGKLSFKYEKNVKLSCTISEIDFAGEEYYMRTTLYYLKAFTELILGKKVSASMKNINKTTTEMLFLIQKN